MTRRYSHIIWDWNGTLFDDLELCIAIENQLLAQCGKPTIDRDRYRDCFDLPVRGFYEAIGFTFSAGATQSFEALMAGFWDAYNARHETECGLHEGALALLSSLSAAGYQHAILSSLPHPQLTAAVARFALDSYFVQVSGHADSSAGSKLERGRALMAALGIAPGKAVLIGDTTHDREVAEALGIDAILVASGHQSPLRLRRTNAPVCETLAAVVRHL
ncbi:HAD family hydrolase [Haliangium ochraceum]|uniref:phosphoglycolate phosphatase n=1 Tax=Haliangium ochraceum (strain DSM 14365 / JCM 11303 / SMP-2) TaxID=502025 RepID=D0LWX5_HALO1|nr:HAD hydrolase-like protein [Haliangium ochraceum]ACY14222.1 Haloacid dehalogenase domain protein hydrolase [Haliangium ochraceum DSM 14365]